MIKTNSNLSYVAISRRQASRKQFSMHNKPPNTEDSFVSNPGV